MDVQCYVLFSQLQVILLSHTISLSLSFSSLASRGIGGQVGGFPCPTKGLLVDTLSLPTFLSVLTTLALAFHHNSHQSWRAFVLDFSLSSQNPGGNESPKSNIFCARVLSTEILALNWIRCRGSNSRTMKRQNSEAKPLLKCLSTLTQDQAIS